MRILIHTADRHVFVVDAYPRRLINELVDRLLAQMGMTSDEASGHKFHGNQWTGGLGAKPDVPTVKGVKAGVAQLLASGHTFTLEDLQKATGAKLKQQILNAILELKKATPAGGLMIVKDPKTGLYKLEVSKGLEAAPFGEMTSLANATQPPSPAVQAEIVAKAKEMPETLTPAPPLPEPAKTFGLWGKAGEAMKAPPTPLSKADADKAYEQKIKSTLDVIQIASGSSDTDEHMNNLALIWKESKAQAMAQWAADTQGKDMMPKAQTVFKADVQLVKDIKAGVYGTEALANWKKNSAGEKAGTWPPDPFKAALEAEKAKAEAAAKEALYAKTIAPEPTFPTVPDYVPKGTTHVSVDEFANDNGSTHSAFFKQMSKLRTALANGHPNSVANKVGVQKSLENRLVASKSFQALVAQRKIKGETGSLVASLISAWAGSSGDHQPKSVANQLAIRDAFDMKSADVSMEALHLITSSGHSENEVYGQAANALGCKHDTEEHRATFKAGLRDFALAQYHETQEHFKAMGIKEVYVARGMKIKAGDKAELGHLKLQPASSFSAKHDTAFGFSSSQSMFYAKVPASQVFSSYVTGFGCTSEHEVVVLAHPELKAVRRKANSNEAQAHAGIYSELSQKSALETSLQQYEKAKAAVHAKPAATVAKTPEGVKKNAHYYKKLKEKIHAHPQHNEAIFTGMKSAGMTNEQVLSTYEKAYKEKFG